MATLAEEILADNPLAYYKMDELAGSVAVNSAPKLKNLIPNPSFEVDTSTWTTQGAGATITRVNTFASVGSWSGRLLYSGASANPLAAQSYANGFAVVPGQTYSARAVVSLDALVGSSVNIGIQWFNSVGTYIGISSGSSPSGAIAVQTFTMSAVAPANAAVGRVVVGCTGPTATSLDMRIDACIAVEGATLPPYFDGATAGCSWDGAANGSSSTRELNGTFTNGPTVGVPGFTQGGDPAVSFDGTGGATSDYVAVPMQSTGIGDMFSFEGWVYVSAIPAQIDFMRGVTTGEPIVYVTTDGRLRIAKLNTITVWTIPAAPVFQVGRYNHVVFTKNGATREIYLNGVAMGGAGTNAVLDVFASTMRFGVIRGASMDTPGQMQHAAIYPTALSAARVLAHYEAGRNALATASIEITSSVAATAHQDIPAGDVEITAVSSMNAGISPNIPIGPVSITATSNMTAAVRNGMTYNVTVEDYRPKRVAVEDYRPKRVEVEAL